MDYCVTHGTAELDSRADFGCRAICGHGHGYGAVDDAISIRALQTAWSLGVRLYDTVNVVALVVPRRLLRKPAP